MKGSLQKLQGMKIDEAWRFGGLHCKKAQFRIQPCIEGEIQIYSNMAIRLIHFDQNLMVIVNDQNQKY